LKNIRADIKSVLIFDFIENFIFEAGQEKPAPTNFCFNIFLYKIAKKVIVTHSDQGETYSEVILVRSKKLI